MLLVNYLSVFICLCFVFRNLKKLLESIEKNVTETGSPPPSELMVLNIVRVLLHFFFFFKKKMYSSVE